MFRRIGALALGLALVLGLVPQASAWAATTIQPLHSGKCVDVPGASTASGVQLIQYSCHGGANQSFEPIASGAYYQLRNVNSGLCLSISGSSTADSAAVVQSACGDYANAKFTLIPDGSGAFGLRALNSGKCVDISGASSLDGAKVIQYSCHTGANQKFRMTIAPTPTPTPSPTPTPTPSPSPTPTGPTPYTTLTVPGRIEAEYFDNGGQNVAWFDTYAGNALGALRSTDVDIEPASTGGYNIGKIRDGEWVRYTFNVATAGTYDVVAHVASIYSTGRLDLLLDGNPIMDDYGVPNTGGWQTWSTIRRQGVYFSQGQHLLVFRAVLGNFNLDAIDVVSPAPSGPIVSGTLRLVDWNIHKGNQDAAKLDAQVRKMWSYQPHVITLQEVDNRWGNSPQEYADMLSSVSGVTWYYKFSSNSPPAGVGPMVLSRIPFDNSEDLSLGCNTWGEARRSAARAQITVGGKPINIWSIHLDYPQDDGTCRLQNTQNLIASMAQFGTLKIAAGDYNASPTGDANSVRIHSTMSGAGYAWSCKDIFGSAGSCPVTHSSNGTGGSQFDGAYRSSGLKATSWIVNRDFSLSDHDIVVYDVQY
jgi:endonuclease/exonuclease/phosphatase family metal-dependent hydrolase